MDIPKRWCYLLKGAIDTILQSNLTKLNLFLNKLSLTLEFLINILLYL